MTTHRDLPRRLVKGQKVALDSLDAGLGGLTVYLDSHGPAGAPFDVDLSVLLLDAGLRIRAESDFVFYNQPSTRDGAVHLRDKLTTSQDSDGDPAQISNVLTLELDDLPDAIERIAFIASVDDDQAAALDTCGSLSLRIQRTSDAADLVAFDISPGPERALVIGDVRRSEKHWQVSAGSDAYQGGLAAVVEAHGIEVAHSDEEHHDEEQHDEEQHDDEPVADDLPEDANAVHQDSTVPTEHAPVEPTAPSPSISMKRAAAPKLARDWNRTIPSGGQNDWQPSRLFPVAGIGSGEEQERRATSALLTVMRLVRDFGRALTVPLGAPRGSMTTFVEVPFGQDDEAYRPDGVIRVSGRAREWTALVEVKTSGGCLNAEQIDHYVGIAKSNGYDAVITISNELCGGDDEHPVAIDRRKLRKVSLFHLSWDQIRSVARLALQQEKVTDPSQRFVLEEFLRYMEHARSGMAGLTDMGQSWVKVRDGVKARTARANDKAVGDVSSRFDELVQHIGFEFTGLLGVDVGASPPRDAPDHASRRQQLADSGIVRGRLKVPGAIEEMVIGADIRTDRVNAAIQVSAPRGDTRPQTRVTWLLRQIPESSTTTLRIETVVAGGRNDGPVATIDSARKDPACLVPKDQRDIKGFLITLEMPMGAKRAAGTGTLIASMKNVSTTFYGDVVQHLRPWVRK